MPPLASTSKLAPASFTVSSSSFLDLKGEVAKREAQFKKDKLSGLPSTTTGGAIKHTGKPSVWAKKNKGIEERNSRDSIALERTGKGQDPERIRAQLERKAELYDKIR